MQQKSDLKSSNLLKVSGIFCTVFSIPEEISRMLCSDCFYYFHCDHSEPPAIKKKKSVDQKETLVCEETIYLNPFQHTRASSSFHLCGKSLLVIFMNCSRNANLSFVTGIDLENIVYYKDNTHYFVMTAKKQSLLDKGVVINVSKIH